MALCFSSSIRRAGTARGRSVQGGGGNLRLGPHRLEQLAQRPSAGQRPGGPGHLGGRSGRGCRSTPGGSTPPAFPAGPGSPRPFPLFIGRAIAGVVGQAGIATGLEPWGLEGGGLFRSGRIGGLQLRRNEGPRLALDPSGLSHRFYYFEGTHDWPDPASCARAAGWMEVTAMKQGLRPKDPALAESVIGRELDDARMLEDAGRVYWAGERLEAAAPPAQGLDLDLAGLQDLASRVAKLKARKEYRQFLDAERARDRKEAEFRPGFGQAFGAVEDPETGGPPAVPKVLQEMRISFLRKDAKTAKTIEERSLASRLLFEFSFAAQARAASLSDARILAGPSAYWDLAIAACEEGLRREKGLYFNRACVAAISGDKKTALKCLSSAVDRLRRSRASRERRRTRPRSGIPPGSERSWNGSRRPGQISGAQ
ncbi:MAG: hypothetical protein MZU84_01770 [Sphingobacterium sp.]|nr:hypothetical protein [Sphingobacterium sp.]